MSRTRCHPVGCLGLYLLARGESSRGYIQRGKFLVLPLHFLWIHCWQLVQKIYTVKCYDKNIYKDVHSQTQQISGTDIMHNLTDEPWSFVKIGSKLSSEVCCIWTLSCFEISGSNSLKVFPLKFKKKSHQTQSLIEQMMFFCISDA